MCIGCGASRPELSYALKQVIYGVFSTLEKRVESRNDRHCAIE